MKVPAELRSKFLSWIDDNGELRRRHGILAELVLERSPRQSHAKTLQADDTDVDPEELVVMTLWPDHDTFDTWIDTPDRDRLTTSPTHDAVKFRPLTRYDLVGGYGADVIPTPIGGQP